MSQLPIEFDETNLTSIQLKNVKAGSLFCKVGDKEVFMCTKTVNFLNNSNLLADQFARGNKVVVNMRKGTCFIMSGESEVLILTGNLKVKRAA